MTTTKNGISASFQFICGPDSDVRIWEQTQTINSCVEPIHTESCSSTAAGVRRRPIRKGDALLRNKGCQAVSMGFAGMEGACVCIPCTRPPPVIWGSAP